MQIRGCLSGASPSLSYSVPKLLGRSAMFGVRVPRPLYELQLPSEAEAECRELPDQESQGGLAQVG